MLKCHVFRINPTRWANTHKEPVLRRQSCLYWSCWWRFIDCREDGRETMFTHVTCLWRHGDSTVARGNHNVTATCPRHPGHCESKSTGALTNQHDQRCSLATGRGLIILIDLRSLRAGLLCCNFFGQPGSVSKFPPFVWVKLWVGWVGRGYTEISRYFPASWINWVTLVTKIKLLYSLRF